MEIAAKLRVSLIQSDLVWEDSKANLDNFANEVLKLKNTTDIIVLPEMFSTGFSMRPHLFAQTMEEDAVSSMKEWAIKTQAAVCGSLMIKEGEKYFNRFIWAEPNGTLLYYDKSHLFRMGEEQKHYSKGSIRLLIAYKGWNIAPFVCYDLRFPVWIRKTPEFNYDLLIFVANWPERRALHWKLLAQARAIENQSYVVAVNRVGADGSEIYHSGDSQVVDALGNVVYSNNKGIETATISLSKEDLVKYRETFPVGLDADKFEI
ncbi:MAG: amidohydrolase [Bacteroidetes bacterium B1(2017)]|nr:MAG: amidohydrolase [Bacteroidetes bacterium B1(2017)]